MQDKSSQYWLDTESDAVENQHLQLSKSETFLFGRDKACQIQIKDARVSRHHAQLRWVDDAFQVRDLNSSNGIHVNGFAIEQVSLKVGDQIKVGDSVFILRGPMAESGSTEIDGVTCKHCDRFVLSPLTECPGCGAPVARG